MSLGKRLKEERLKNGWSQIFVAEKVGITNTVLSNYERDYRDPDTETLSKLAFLYKVTTDYLLTGEKPADINDERDFHFFNIHGLQLIARSKKNLSPEAFKKMQELAKKAQELFDEDED